MSKTASTRIAAVLSIALAAPAAAQQQPTPPPSPEHVKALIQQVMTQTQTTPEGVQVQPAIQGAAVNLTADEAVARALDRNLTLASQRLTPRTFDYSIAATRAAYRPLLTSTVSNNSQTQLPSTSVEGGLVVNTDTQVWNSGFQQNVPWGGGNYSVSFNNSRDFSTRNTGLFNPTFGSTFRVQYNQPILQNFKIDNTRTQLRDAEHPAGDRGSRSAGDGGEHRRGGAQRVLGAGLCVPGRRGGAALAGTGGEAGRR